VIRRRIALAYWVIALSLFTPSAVYAYIDPATTTYLIQIATALVITVGISLSVFLYRFKMISSKIRYFFYGLIYRTKGKQGGVNAEKTERKIPDDFKAFFVQGAEAAPELTSFDEGVQEYLTAEKKEIPVSYFDRMRQTIPLALAFCFSFLIIGCLELALRFSHEIPFNISLIIPTVLLCFAVFFVFLILVVPGLRGRAFELVLAIGFAVLLAGYIQGTFLNWGLGKLTGDAVVWSDFRPQLAASLICWAGCIVLSVFLWRRARKAWRKLLLIVPVLLIMLQGIGFVSVVYDRSGESLLNERGKWSGEGDFWKTADEALTSDRINEVAADNNAIIIVLDRLDQEFVEEVAFEEPGFFDPLDGFTEFDDFITYNGMTFPSVTGYLTGHRFMYDMPQPKYFDFAWENADFMHAVRERGSDIRIYIERGQAYSRISQLAGIPSNIFEGELNINKRIALIKLLKLSGYRYAPIPVKQFFWFSPTEFIDTLELTDETSPYITDDFRYYANLKEKGLSVSGIVNESLIYIHLQGPHPPLHMDENVQWVEESTLIEQTKGSFRIVYEYLRQLKEIGMYESSLIIVMGDHGNYVGDDLEKPAHAGLFVKPAGSAGTPLDVSHAPVSPDQLHATLMEGLFGTDGGFGPTFFDISEGDDIVRKYDINLWRYEITGDGRDFSNWRFTGNFPDTYE